MASTIVDVRGVTKDFGRVQAVKGVDLQVEQGELFGLIGHNGAGKSTLFKMMLGLLPVTAGEIRIDGATVHGPDYRDTRRRIGYLPENVILYDNLTGLETLYFFADLKSVPRSTCAAALERVGLNGAAHRRVREYSKGMRQRLGFAQALLGKPALLFLDEPTTGLDPAAIRDFYRTLRDLRDAGVTMILTSHILAEIQERVDRLAIMEDGRIRACGTVQQLRDALDPLLAIELVPAAGFHALAALGETVRSALAGIDVESVEAVGEVLSIRLPRTAKLPALARMSALGDAVRDLQVRESSLEDVFFGYRS